MTNRYFVCARGRPPVEFELSNTRPAEGAEISYFVRGLQLVERLYHLDGYTICLAWGALTPLPFSGPKVVAVLYGEEHCRIPAYVNDVAAVIKCHGLFPNFVPRRRPLRLMQIEAVEFLRNLALWVPTGWRWAISTQVRARCHLIPLGYSTATDQISVPFNERPYLASFLGSVAAPKPQAWLRRLLGTPKSFCRTAMLRAMRSLEAAHGRDRIRLRITGTFQESMTDAGKTYHSVLANSRLCIAPRGTSHETLRIYEGLRLGCVVISDFLPPHPFYKDSPIIQIEDWADLPALVDALVRDPDRMRKLHERGRRYWEDVLSERALARSIAGALGLRPRDEDGVAPVRPRAMRSAPQLGRTAARALLSLRAGP